MLNDTEGQSFQSAGNDSSNEMLESPQKGMEPDEINPMEGTVSTSDFPTGVEEKDTRTPLLIIGGVLLLVSLILLFLLLLRNNFQ